MLACLIGVPGFEPGIFRPQSGRDTRLRHTPSRAECSQSQRLPIESPRRSNNLTQTTNRLRRAMDLKRLTNRAKDLVEKRGGPESVKEDAGELRDIAKGQDSLKDKAKAAAEAIKQPGAESAKPDEEATHPARS